MQVDLNCDMGEGMADDAALMPLLSSANIACGYHAGNEDTMRTTLALASQYGVRVGAHISFADRENFGRTEMQIPLAELYELVVVQVRLFASIASSFGLRPAHVKPHGALYNQSARDENIARTIAAAIKETDPRLILFGLSGSHSIKEAKAAGLKTASEVFADRSYQDDGSLTPRSHPDAMIETEAEAIRQALEMVKEGRVTTVSGLRVPVIADTICIHGDGPHALSFARALAGALNAAGVRTTASRS